MNPETPTEFNVSAIPYGDLWRYGKTVLRSSFKTPPKPKCLDYSEAAILVDRKWREIHGDKIMPPIFRPISRCADGRWTMRHKETGEPVAYVISEMVIIGWTMKLCKVKGKDEEVERKKTVYSQENSAVIDKRLAFPSVEKAA